MTRHQKGNIIRAGAFCVFAFIALALGEGLAMAATAALEPGQDAAIPEAAIGSASGLGTALIAYWLLGKKGADGLTSGIGRMVAALDSLKADVVRLTTRDEEQRAAMERFYAEAWPRMERKLEGLEAKLAYIEHLQHRVEVLERGAKPRVIYLDGERLGRITMHEDSE